jgi:hypothetical protein
MLERLIRLYAELTPAQATVVAAAISGVFAIIVAIIRRPRTHYPTPHPASPNPVIDRQQAHANEVRRMLKLVGGLFILVFTTVFSFFYGYYELGKFSLIALTAYFVVLWVNQLYRALTNPNANL